METSYQMSEVLALCDRERDYPSPIKITVLTLLVNKSTMKHSGFAIFLIRGKTLNQISYS